MNELPVVNPRTSSNHEYSHKPELSGDQNILPLALCIPWHILLCGKEPEQKVIN